MHDINIIKDLLSRQSDLTAHYEELDALMDDFKSLRENQEFIPENISSSISSRLTELQAEQKSFIAGYEKLDFGDTPSSIAECKYELEDYEKYIVEKSTYVDVINFVLSLDSDNAEAKAALKQHKAFAAAYNCRTNTIDQCKADLKKYILLKKAFEEQDPTRRLSDIIELSPIIDFPLVVALNTNSLTSSGRKPSVSAAAAENASAPLPATGGFTAAPFAGKPETSDTRPESTSDSTAETISSYKNKSASANEDNSVFDDPDQTQIFSKFPMPDFKVPQKPISNRPAPDEAPVSHKGIENGLTAELTQVLSRETMAASLTADIDTAAVHASGRSDLQTKQMQDPWNEIGIHNPAAVCYSVPDECLDIFRCERPKKFSVADFQKEMSLKTANRFSKQWALKDAYKYGGTTPHLLAALINEKPEPVTQACDTLVDSGYLKAFELKGAAFDEFEKLYVLTASGRKVFTNKETASILNLAAAEKAATPPFSSKANAVLNRQLFLKSKNLMERYMPSRQFNVGSFILETNSFINFFPATNGSGIYAYVSALGDVVKDYLIFKVELQEVLPDLDTVTVVGMTKEHAKALADWIYSSFTKELSGKTFQYYSLENDTYYSYIDGVSFRK